jgi:Xaa-Pro aminopeptidase
MNARSLPTIHVERRARLMDQMAKAGGGVAVIGAAPEVMRNSDSEYPYRQDSYLHYLTGFGEPHSLLVLVANDSVRKAVLFCRPRDVEREMWDGLRLGPLAAAEALGIDEAHDIAQLDALMPDLLANQASVFQMIGGALDGCVTRWIETVRGQIRAGKRAPATMHELRGWLDEMRLFKDASEIDIMRRAAQISAGAHVRAMRACKPGLREYHLEAELLHEFRRHGSDGPAYTSIVGTGANSCILHYRAGNTEILDGDMVLIDAGCELDCYASDVTRTFPANGRFNGPQKAVYELVLAAQEAALACVKPGARFKDYHHAATRVLAQGVIDLGWISGSVDGVIESGAHHQFYMHGAGHWLGLDVHDAGEYADLVAPYVENQERTSRVLQAGMVLTVEPGLYVRPCDNAPREFWNIGVRIEDDVLVTTDGCELFSRAAPVTVAQIEEIMRG